MYVFLLSCPLKITIEISDSIIKFKFFCLTILIQNLFDAGRETLEVAREKLKDEKSILDKLYYLNILKKIKIKKFQLEISNSFEDYFIYPSLMFPICGILLMIKQKLVDNKIDFNLKINYDKQSLYLNLLFTVKVGTLFVEYLRLRRIKNERTPNSSIIRHFFRKSSQHDRYSKDSRTADYH